jgi:hypothetical protein
MCYCDQEDVFHEAGYGFDPGEECEHRCEPEPEDDDDE